MYSKDQQDQNAAMLDMDIQQEEVLAFFRDYWKQIIGIAVALLILTGALQVYRNWDARVSGQQMAELLPLASAQPTAGAAKALENFAATKASGNRKALALLFAASKYQAIDDMNDARRVLSEIISSSAPNELRNYARILFVNAGGDPKTLDQVGKNSAWQIAVSEIKALAETDAQKQRDDFAVIAADPHAPPGMHSRAALFSGEGQAE